MDEVWKHTPNDILERIAHFADIDTRRAMGFDPRRLIIPDILLRLPLVREALPFSRTYGPPKPIFQQNLSTGRYLYVVNFENGIELHIHPVVMAEYWYFREKSGNFQYKTSYSFMYDTKEADFCSRQGWKYGIHPDFNEDGSFKRSHPYTHVVHFTENRDKLSVKRTPFISIMEIILIGIVAVAVGTSGAVGYWLYLCCTPREPVGYDPNHVRE
jgi:hypothetical protein